jgi:hypothetical protein
VNQKRPKLSVSLRHVYESVRAWRTAGHTSVNGHWRLDCACPSCGGPVVLGLAAAYNRRGYVVSHELLPAEPCCPACGERLSERQLLYCGVQPEATEELGVDTWKTRAGPSGNSGASATNWSHGWRGAVTRANGAAEDARRYIAATTGSDRLGEATALAARTWARSG